MIFLHFKIKILQNELTDIQLNYHEKTKPEKSHLMNIYVH